jgi:hypothetical protein
MYNYLFYPSIEYVNQISLYIIKYLEENVGADQIQLTPDQIQSLSAVQPAAGERYPAAAMAFVKG